MKLVKWNISELKLWRKSSEEYESYFHLKLVVDRCPGTFKFWRVQELARQYGMQEIRITENVYFAAKQQAQSVGPS